MSKFDQKSAKVSQMANCNLSCMMLLGAIKCKVKPPKNDQNRSQGPFCVNMTKQLLLPLLVFRRKDIGEAKPRNDICKSLLKIGCFTPNPLYWGRGK